MYEHHTITVKVHNTLFQQVEGFVEAKTGSTGRETGHKDVLFSPYVSESLPDFFGKEVLFTNFDNSVHLDVSGDNDLHLLLKNYRCYVIKIYSNIKLDSLGIRLVNDSIQLKLCKWRYTSQELPTLCH